MNTKNEGNLLPIRLGAVVLDCPDVAALSSFYTNMLGWELTYDEGDEWADISSPSGDITIAFQRNDMYIAPVWPEEPCKQQQMAHLDFMVRDAAQLRMAVEHALHCGAMLATVQYGAGRYITLSDPAGHPFCFVIG